MYKKLISEGKTIKEAVEICLKSYKEPDWIEKFNELLRYINK